MTHLVIVAHEALGTRMTGPAIRYWEIARTLAPDVRVTLAVPEPPDLVSSGFRIVTYSREAPESLESLARDADAILLSTFLLRIFPQLGRTGCPLIVDLYDPFPIENLHLRRDRPRDDQVAASADDFEMLGELLRAGDFFLCGSERQRAFWLGMLAASGRINPLTYPSDPTLGDLVAIVPMGMPDTPPVCSGTLKGVRPGIAADDFLVVWPGGVWDWLDPLTAVEGVARVVGEAPDVKLYFPGLSHPHPERVGAMENPARVLQRARELKLLDRHAFYDDWTPYAARAGYLADADLALSLHRETLEAHLAIRARLLDCIWARTPVISTTGDAVAETMAAGGLASLVAPSRPDEVAEAILRWRSARAERARLDAAFEQLATRYRWSAVCEPLRQFLRNPRRAADRQPERDRPGAGPVDVTCSTASAGPRWQTDEVLELPFDQYQRHRQAAQIIETFREPTEQSFRVLDVGGGPAVTRRFLSPNDLIVSLDLRPSAGPLTVAGDATQLPFADEAFDFVVTLDTLEHLPSGRRPRMIEECLRVARRGFILIAPSASPEAVAAEHLLFEFIRVVLRAEHEQLREHIQNGLPEPRALEAHLRELGYPYLVRPSGYVHRWLAMMLVKHHVMSLPGSEQLHRQIDHFYNRHFFEADQRAPSYRSLIFVAKSGGTAAVKRASGAVPVSGDVPDTEARDGSDLGWLGLLAQLLTLKTIANGREHSTWPQERIAQLERELGERAADHERQVSELQQAIHARDYELEATRALLARVARGRMMRLMNALHGFLGR